MQTATYYDQNAQMQPIQQQYQAPGGLVYPQQQQQFYPNLQQQQQ